MLSEVWCFAFPRNPIENSILAHKRNSFCCSCVLNLHFYISLNLFAFLFGMFARPISKKFMSDKQRKLLNPKDTLLEVARNTLLPLQSNHMMQPQFQALLLPPEHLQWLYLCISLKSKEFYAV